MRCHSFREEEYAGVHPEITSDGGNIHNKGEFFSKLIKHFDNHVEPFYTPDRNTALAFAISALTEKNDSCICSDTSYVSGRGYPAIRRISGTKPVRVTCEYGKLNPDIISGTRESLCLEERKKCRVISISQPTEYGIVYSPEEIAEICNYAHENGMFVQMDGSRIFFATARILRAFREQTLDAGVDVATFGGTKNGSPAGEAVLIFRTDAAGRFGELQKKLKIDASEAFSFSSGINRLLTDRLWRSNALHANEIAAELAHKISAIPGIRPVCRVETNKVVAETAPQIFQKLKETYSLKSFRCPNYTVRFVTNYATSDKDVKRLVDTLKSVNRHN